MIASQSLGVDGICELAPATSDIEPTIIIVYGATGDLAHRKIFPALYNLLRNEQMPGSCSIVAFARRSFTDDAFRTDIRAAIENFSHAKPVDSQVVGRLCAMIQYHQGEFDEAHSYMELTGRVAALTSPGQPRRILHYLATSPDFFGVIASHLSHVGLSHTDADGFSRLIVEKPFGRDGASASKLNESLRTCFAERDIFRIDHYLGKDTVQNLLYFRFANSIFEPLWNYRYVDHVQISVMESVGVGSRAGYYEGAGASRDMLQNHLMQLFTLVAMEPPSSLEAEAIRDEKVKVLRSLPRYTPQVLAQRSVRGQYTADGSQIGYLKEAGVRSNSNTETYVALQLNVDNWRWEGVPFFLRTGKAMGRQVSEICIVFKRPPQVLFAGFCGERLRSNQLRIRIQPNEGIQLRFNTKTPGRSSVEMREMNFSYRGGEWAYFPEAYERLLVDALVGDATQFTRWEEVEHAWKIVDSMQVGWAEAGMPLAEYAAGTCGPAEANALIERLGRNWETPCHG